MTEDLEQKLYELFPEIFRDKDKTPQETCMCWGICVGSGWFNILHDLCTKIMEVAPETIAIQVKEKFGGLRFYYWPHSEAVDKLVSEAEAEALSTCEYCGTNTDVTTEGPGWVKTLCKSCRYE